MTLTPAIERFVLHWGEMGTRWGMNRSVSQIHALLYLSDKPLTAEEIAETLSMARSNVSNSLKELLSWRLIELTHVMGDRRDHYEAITDMWEMVSLIIEGRKNREIDPTIAMLRQAMNDIDKDKGTNPVVGKRIKAMMNFLDLLMGWYEQMSKLPQSTLKTIIKMGGRITRLIDKG